MLSIDIMIGRTFKKAIRPIIEAGRTHVHMDLIVGLPYEIKHDLDYPLTIYLAYNLMRYK